MPKVTLLSSRAKILAQAVQPPEYTLLIIILYALVSQICTTPGFRSPSPLLGWGPGC